MSSFRSDPFLWIHLSGIAVAPLALLVVWISLGNTTPLPFYWLEFLLVASIGILPILWMQWSRPFDIYSFLIVAIKNDLLTEEQRKILHLFKSKKQHIFTAITAVIMLVVLWLIYQWSPVAGMITTLAPPSRIIALFIAGIAFLVSNLFVQVPVSVLGVLLTNNNQFAATDPLPVETISQEFSIFGFRVKQLFSTNS